MVADGDYQITFTIYDGGGVSQWSSGQQDIPVANGLFNYLLGSAVQIPSTIFGEGALFLGIKVGADPEMVPKTLLTSSPSAAVAYNLAGGNVKTSNGILTVMNSDQTEAIEMGSLERGGVGIRLKSTQTPERNLLTITGESDTENRIDLYYPGADADAGIVQLGADETLGGFIEIHAAEPLLSGRVRMGGSIADTGYVTLFGGSHRAEYKLLEMKSHTNLGGSLSFFNPDPTDDRELMTLGCTPENGISIVGFNPQPEPPGMPIFELGMNSGKTSNGMFFRMNNPQTAFLEEPSFEMSTGPAGEMNMFFFNPQPDPPGRVDMSMGTSEEFGPQIVMFNPQPEPPGQIGIEMTTNSAKGAGGNLNVYTPDSIRTSLSGGNLEIGHLNGAVYPSGSFSIDQNSCYLNLTGESAAGGSSVITMTARPDSAKVGIGIANPEEALHVAGNIVATGEVFALTETKYKTDIRSIDNAIDLIRNINGVRYNYRSDEYPEMKLPERDQIGVLAEDVEKVLPELVFEDSQGAKYVAYTKLTAVLIEAIKELETENEELKARIEALEQK
jgi:hypothetical protein